MWSRTEPVACELRFLRTAADIERRAVPEVDPTTKRPARRAPSSAQPARAATERFFRPLIALSERDLAYLTEIDHRDHEALAAIDPRAATGGRCTLRARRRAPAGRGLGGRRRPWQRRGVATAPSRAPRRAGARGRDHALRGPGHGREHRRNPALRAPRARPRAAAPSASGHLEPLIELPEPGAFGAGDPGPGCSGSGHEVDAQRVSPRGEPLSGGPTPAPAGSRPARPLSDL